MPKLLKILIERLKKKGKSPSQAYSIAVSALQKAWDLKPWTIKATAQWKKRWNMTHAERVKARLARYRKK